MFGGRNSMSRSTFESHNDKAKQWNYFLLAIKWLQIRCTYIAILIYHNLVTFVIQWHFVIITVYNVDKSGNFVFGHELVSVALTITRKKSEVTFEYSCNFIMLREIFSQQDNTCQYWSNFIMQDDICHPFLNFPTFEPKRRILWRYLGENPHFWVFAKLKYTYSSISVRKWETQNCTLLEIHIIGGLVKLK